MLPGHPGREALGGDLAELLWPKSDERRARTDLRSIMTRVRKTLGEDGARGGGRSEGVRLLPSMVTSWA